MKQRIYFKRTSFITVFIFAAFFMQGCKPKLLPSSNVPATSENKKVVAFLEKYKSAIERRSVDSILELVAKDFRDNMGQPDNPAIHLDYLGLKEKLERLMPRVQDIRLGMFVQRVAKIEKDIYEAVFYFNKQILTEVPAGEKWTSVKEVSRMILRKRNEKNAPYEFEILQGI